MEIKSVLGVTIGVCSSAALFKDGRIVASVSEERFTKKKNYDGYPKNAIELCLKLGNIAPESIDCVVLASYNIDPIYIITHQECDRTTSDWVREMREYWYPIFYGGKKRSYIDVFKDKLDFKQYPGNFSAIPFSSQRRIKLFQGFRKDMISKHTGIPRS